jgi:hypothetical protein
MPSDCRFFPANFLQTGGFLPKMTEMTENRRYLTEYFPNVLQDKGKYRTIFALSLCEGSYAAAQTR